MASSASVQVCVRLRPLNRRETSSTSSHIPVVTTNTAASSITIVKGLGNKAIQHKYTVDSVFGSFAEQQEIFDTAVLPLVGEVLNGYESTVFAYGQTGTGKTYTMEGDISSEQHKGVIPRSCEAIFQQLSEKRYLSSKVSCSYLEIYNEELSDLLVDVEEKNTKALRVCTTSKNSGGRVVCMGLSSRTVTTPQEVLAILNEAAVRRQVGETNMNKQSSRSHCLFTLQVESTESVEGGSIDRVGKLHLVDLAGSECAKSTGAKSGGVRMRESQNINKSLLTLGRVISTLRNGTGRVPYRDSKLTRLLQEALGGRCKTLIIATLSPSILSIEESLSTMSYAEQAHGIKNKPIEARARMQMSVSGSSSSSSGGSGGSSSGGSGDSSGDVSTRTFVEMEQKLHYYQSQCSEAQGALAKKHLQVSAMSKRATAAEMKVEETQLTIDTMEKDLKVAQDSVLALQNNTLELALSLKKRTTVVEKRKETEELLSKEAALLLSTLHDLSSRNQSDYTQLVQFHNHHTKVCNVASDTSAAVEEETIRINATNHRLHAFMNTSTTTIDEQTRVTKTSMLQLARNCGLGTAVQFQVGQELSNQVSTWTSENLSSLRNVQRTMNDVMSKTRTSIKKQISGLQNQTDRMVKEWKQGALDSEQDLNACIQTKINQVVADRTASRHATHTQLQSTVQNNQNNQVQFDVELTHTLTQQASSIERLLVDLNHQEQQLMSHSSTLHTTTEHIVESCTSTTAQLKTLASKMKTLQKLTATTMMKKLKKQEQNLDTHFIQDVCAQKFDVDMKHLTSKQHEDMEQAVEAAELGTHTCHAAASLAIGALSSDTWGNFSKGYGKRQEEFNQTVETNLCQGRKGNLHESLKISINAGSNDVLNLLTLQRQRLSDKCMDRLVQTSKQHQSTFQDISERSNEQCSDIRERVASSLSSARIDIATTMDTLGHVVEVHSTQREQANTQHAFDLDLLTKSLRTTTEQQRKQLQAQELALQSILEKQRDSQRTMVDTVMNTVRTMLEKNVQQMSNDLDTQVATIRSNNEELNRGACDIDGTVEVGKISLNESTAAWYRTGQDTEIAMQNTIQQEMHSLHDSMQDLEKNLQEDVNEMVMHVAERDALDTSTLAVLNEVQSQVEEEIKTHVTTLSTRSLESTTLLLQESAEWNANTIQTHQNMAELGEKSTRMMSEYQETLGASELGLEEIQTTVEQWKKENNTTVINMKTMLSTNEDLSKALDTTKELIGQHVHGVVKEIQHIRELVEEGTDSTLDLYKQNQNLMKEVKKNKTVAMQHLTTLKTEIQTMKGAKDAKDAKEANKEQKEQKEHSTPSNCHMHRAVELLQSFNAHTASVLVTASAAASTAHQSHVDTMSAFHVQDNTMDAALVTSMTEYMAQRNIQTTQFVTEESDAVLSLLNSTCSAVAATVEEQQQATMEATTAANAIRSSLEDRTTEAMHATMTNVLTTMNGIVVDCIENVDVCMTSMENQTTSTTSQMRISTKKDTGTIAESVEEMRRQHSDVLCDDCIQVQVVAEQMEPQGIFE